MTPYSLRSRAALGALMVCCAMLPLLSACSLYSRVFHHGRKDAGCTERPFALNTEVRPPLKVPEGMSAPDTRNAIKVPELTSPERAQAQACLSRPPSYFADPLKVAQPAPLYRQHWWQFWRGKAPVSTTVSQPASAPEPAPAAPVTPPAVPPESK